MKAQRVVIFHGAVSPDAPPDEQDVLVEVQAVSDALKRLGYQPEPLALTLDLQAPRAQFKKQAPALVFNLVESIGGSGRLAPLGAALLEDLGLAYTGVPHTGLFLSSNKPLAKRLLALDGISTPAWCAAGATPRKAAERWIVKSVWEHASIGINDENVVTAAQVDAILVARHTRFGGEWFAEEYIEGREFNVALIGDRAAPQVLPPAEIRFIDFPADKPRIVGYTAKWASDSFEYAHTQRSFDFASSERPLLDKLAEIARRCWRLFECGGYARVDFRVDRAGRPWVLEVNANPCLAPNAGLAAAAARVGLSYDALIAKIVEHVSHP